jgi:general secretion pathway protein G
MHMRLRQLLLNRTAWRDARGWTLLELVIVMALIILLAGIATAQHRNAVTRTKEAVLKENLFRMRDAIDQYYADKNRSANNSSWQTVPAEADPSNPSVDVGIYNVKSGSAGIALDGTNYADW